MQINKNTSNPKKQSHKKQKNTCAKSSTPKISVQSNLTSFLSHNHEEENPITPQLNLHSRTPSRAQRSRKEPQIKTHAHKAARNQQLSRSPNNQKESRKQSTKTPPRNKAFARIIKKKGGE